MDTIKADDFYFLPELFLRAPQYSFNSYELSRLPEVLQQQEFKNAVWLASPDFYQILVQKDFDFDRLNDKERFTAGKYYNRICYRPTPFGSFSSFTLLKWETGAPVIIADKSDAKLHVLPDQQHLSPIGTQLDLPTAELIINPCLYKLDKTYRFPQGVLTNNKKYDFKLKALDAVKFHQQLIALFNGGRMKTATVLRWIERHGACTATEAAVYLSFLLEEQALLSPARGALIYANWQDNGASFQDSADAFWNFRSSIAIQATAPLTDFAFQMESTPGNIGTGKKQAFYAALERPLLSGGPGSVEQMELDLTLKLLRRLAVPHQSGDLSRFIQEFRKRFDRETVPLLLALDPDAGISYGDLLNGEEALSVLENMRFSQEVRENPAIKWSGVHRLLFRLWTGNKLRDPWSPLEIQEKDLTELDNEKFEPLPFPQTQAILYRRTAEYLIVEQAGGVTAASMIGRFSCFSEDVYQLSRKLAGRESDANPGVLFADIGQLSDTHVDNINRRRCIYSYEIPINVYSSLPDEQQLRPDDLLISVVGNELVLESRRLGKRVVPRLATAYNFRHNQLSIFRLLCDLQFQGLTVALSLNLEQLFPELDFYPRVSYQNSILSLAKWKLTGEQVLPLFSIADGELLSGVRGFRQKWHIPRYISLGDSDQQLVFDLTDLGEARLFVRCLKGLKKIAISEYLLADRSVRSGNKPLAGQFVAFQVHEENIYSPLRKVTEPSEIEGPRNFMIGSNWLYLKIYCTPRIANAILLEVVRPFITSHRKMINRWFFIRYHDNRSHLRLRIHALEKDLGPLLVNLQKRIMAGGYDKMIHDYRLDTYRQEIERYGAALMPIVETLFQAGSALVVWFLSRTAQGRDWSQFQLGLTTADLMLKSFFPDQATRLTLIRKVIQSFFLEFGGNKELKADMDLKYRALRVDMDAAMQNKDIARKMALVLKGIKEINKSTTGRQQEEQFGLAVDIIHMQMNRTFDADQRKQEYLVYYCLEKKTISELSRSGSL
jgi:thiopeptide-type bacteriocin biosynthesis protein